MLNAKGSILTDNRSLTQWAGAALGLPEVQVQVRLRGNHLHILCEATDSPPLDMVVAKYSAALSVTDLEKLLPRPKGYNHPRIYQIFLCGRKLGARQNEWAIKLDYPGENPHLTPIKNTEAQTASTVIELADVKEVRKTGKKNHKSRSSAHQPIAEPFTIPNSESIRHKNHGQSVTQTTESEAFVTSPLTIDTASTVKLTPDSFPFDTFSDPMTAGQTAHQHTAILEVPLPKSNSTSQESGMMISCEGLARRGYPDAIASYLSEILGALGVAVKVTIREQKHRKAPEKVLSAAEENGAIDASGQLRRRLWVLCESAYSPDPSLLAEPIARRLRDLKLENFRDAVICSQVSGEKSPEWLLRVDLTPQSHILKEWARWGDREAIARLLNQELVNLGIEVRATLKEFTLHLFCHLKYPVRDQLAPDKLMTTEAIDSLLTAIAPCGIRAATVYGLKAPQRTDDEVPVWIDWINLPAANHPDLAVTPRSLAIQGDREALLFLINRLLNPHLDQKLQTGGIRAMILSKGNLLHIMTEAPTCPSQSQVGPTVGEFLRQLQIPGISGVRVYGRRAGQKLPLWRYGVEVQRQEEVVEHQELESSNLAIIPPKSLSLNRKVSFLEDVTTEFAVSATDMSFTGLDGALVLLPDFSVVDLTEEVLTSEVRIERSRLKLSTILLGLQRSLIASGLFVPNDDLVTTVAGAGNRWRDRQSIFVVVWAATGCLLASQVDAFLGNFLEFGMTNTTATQLVTPENITKEEGRGKKEEGRGKKEEVRGKKEEVRGKKEEVRGKKEEEREKKEEGRGKKEEVRGKKEEGKSRESEVEKVAKLENLGSQESSVRIAKTREVSLPESPLQPILQGDSTEVFNASGFTKPAIAANRNHRESSSKMEAVTNYPSFKSDQLDEQLVRYQKYIQTHKRLPDIMIVGSSRALRGIEPRVLEQALAEQGYPGLLIYNFGVNGATVQVVDLIVRQILPVEQLPKLILFADGARAVNSGRVDVTYNAISTSEGYKQLTQGTFHIKNTAKSFAPTPLSSVTELMQNINGSGVALEEFLHQKLLAVSATYRNRDRLKAFLYSSLVSRSTIGRSSNQTHQIVEGKLMDNGTNSKFDSNGFLPINLRFDPATYYEKYSQVPGDYDADYQSFKLVGKQTDALKNLWEYTKANNINLVFVNMPLTKDYLDPIRKNYEEEFRQKMQDFAATTGLNFQDMVMLWPEARENFSDPSHLNQYGAVEVSKYLAKDAMIAWPKRQNRN